MLEIELRFPSGRFHATPWDHHVNEGVVEWPPSPWRLLRALIATWYLKSTETEQARSDDDECRLRSLIWALAAEPPVYALPQGVPSHTRHYMPLFKDATTKVFDTFLDVGAAPLLVRWPELELAPAERLLLERLVPRLGYLGRAESWVQGTLGVESRGEIADVVPVAPGDGDPSSEEETVRVLTPMRPSEYASWRVAELSRREERSLAEKKARARAHGKDPVRERLTAKDRQRISAALPDSLFEALQADTSALRKAGWSDPPGSRWVDYRRPAGKVNPRPAPRKPQRAPETGRTVARFALASAALPRLTEALAVAEKVRLALLKWADGAPVFAGHNADGPLRGHRHAFFLPEANGRQGRITHITVYAEMGFEESALRALHRLPKVWGHGGHDIQTVLIGVGTPESFAGERGTFTEDDLEAGRCPLLATSPVWISRTPFVSTRHPKATRRGEPKLDERGLQIGSPEHDLRRLLRELDRGYPEPLHVQPLAGTHLGGKAVRWSAFRTQRAEGEGRRASGVAYGFRIEFPRPVRGPIAVGYGAHFGLGVFAPPIDPFRPVERRA